MNVAHHLGAFTRLCLTSPEYQGHGWGCAVWRGDAWDQYRTLKPIWDDDYRPTGDVFLLIAHARSAYRDEGIFVENNMPFISEHRAFVFNGELQGVRLPVQGSTGAQRLFRFIKNRCHGDSSNGLLDAITILRQRTVRIRACNFILADPAHLYVHSLFDAEPDYFTLYRRHTPDELIICSSRYDDQNGSWLPMKNGSLEIFACSF